MERWKPHAKGWRFGGNFARQVSRSKSTRVQQSSARSRSRPTKQATGSCACIVATTRDFDSVNEGMPVPPGTLDNPLAACGQIMNHGWQIKAQIREIDDIEVSAIAGCDDSAVV